MLITIFCLLSGLSQNLTNSSTEKVELLSFASEYLFFTAEEDVLQTEKARFAAMVVKNFEVLDKLISEDLYYIHSNGNIDTKKTFIEAIKNGSRSYDDITIEEPMVRIYGEVGIINAKCIYHRVDDEGKNNNLKLHYTSVYALLEGRWQHISWQSYKVY